MYKLSKWFIHFFTNFAMLFMSNYLYFSFLIVWNELTKKFPNLDANIIGVIRGDKFLIPKKNDDIQKEDKIYVIINSSQMAQTLEVFGHKEKISKKI